MAGVEVTITGMLYDKLSRTTQNVVLIGEATLTGLGVGGGPMPPGQGGGGGDKPPGIWGPPGPWPTPPIHLPPGQGGGQPPGGGGQPPGIWPGPGPLPHPEHPIVLPPDQVPPEQKPPQVPPPGTVTPVPPPAGSGGWPVQPQTMPEYVVLNYPGYGPVVVTPPSQPAPTPG